MKKTFTLKTCFFVFALLLSASAWAQVRLVHHGKPVSHIVVTTPEKSDSIAASLLQDFVKRITGVELPVYSCEGKQKIKSKGTVFIGNGKSNASLGTSALREDGFRISTEDGNLRIVNGGDKGSIYGVVTLLERYLGVQYWGENEYTLTPSTEIDLPRLNIMDNPAFRYRQSQFYGMNTDPVYRLWMRFEEPKEFFAAGYWVHTFNRIMPASVYGKEHPEYYSFFNGERHLGTATQWCLTNEELFERVCEKVDSIFKANPNQHMLSISQNDGNHTNCKCDACRAIDEREGSPAGTLVYFLNKLAKRFPDKEFSTLSYIYSMQPPKYLKPLPNVNIMLCNIDCCREVTLTENASGQEFMRALKGWSSKTDNIYVWDYGINFDNFLTPFPNFHILADNIKIFREHHVQMLFSQVAGSRGGDFAEMRTWLLSKLMWNPDADTDELLHTFLQGYYGKAAPYLYQYIKMMEGALISSGQKLWIFDSPVSHKFGMLRPALLKRYKALFDSAEAAVADNQICLERVQRTRLPLLYSELELDRTNPNADVASMRKKVDYFEEQVKLHKVLALNERHNSPLDYCQLYRKRFIPDTERSLAANAKIEFILPPHKRYAKMAETALTDGLKGGQSFVESWVGWEGTDASFIVDLGDVKKISSISTDLLFQQGQWVLLPKNVSYSVSTDGNNYVKAGSYDLAEERSIEVKYYDVKHTFQQKTPVRYIRVDIEGTKICPYWHCGVGHPCWFFVDEITVL